MQWVPRYRPIFKVVTDLRFVMTQQFRPNTNLTMRTRLITPRPVEHEESSVLLNVNPVGQEITVGTRCTNDRCFCPPCAHNQWVESQCISLRNQKATNGRIVPLHLSPVNSICSSIHVTPGKALPSKMYTRLGIRKMSTPRSFESALQGKAYYGTC
jgi:hypothetical protein